MPPPCWRQLAAARRAARRSLPGVTGTIPPAAGVPPAHLNGVVNRGSPRSPDDRGGDQRGGGKLPWLHRAIWPAAARRDHPKRFRSYTAADPGSTDQRMPTASRNSPNHFGIILMCGTMRASRAVFSCNNIARLRRGRTRLWCHRYVIAAIWGVETNYGTIGGERPVIRSTATLACIGRRQNYSAKNSYRHGNSPARRRQA
jgi:hypothetical protein